MEILLIHCQFPVESALAIHGSIYCPELIVAEPRDNVVEPLINPAMTTSLFGVVSTEFIITGFAALPEEDQSPLLRAEKKFFISSFENSTTSVCCAIFTLVVCEISDVKKSKITVDTNNRLEFLSAVMALPHIPHGGGGNECFPNIN